MTIPEFNSALNHYESTLTTLENNGRKPTPEVVIEVLIARDEVQKKLQNISKPPARKLKLLVQLDLRLKKQAGKIAEVLHQEDYRTSFNTPDHSWWWHLDSFHPLNKFDWLWSSLTVVAIIVSVSLAVEISSRFLIENAGFLSAFAVIFQSALTIITAGGVLTKKGRTGINRFLIRIGIKSYWFQEVKLGLSAMLLIFLLSFRTSLPWISQHFNEQGLEHNISGQIGKAKSNYELAISLDSDNMEAHFNLGHLYQDLQEIKKAKIQYSTAAQGGLDIAYNNLGRLYILERKYSQASSLLRQGLNSNPEEAQIEYALLKNLGWSLWKQKRYGDAESLLREAISFDQEVAAASINSVPRGAAHCLLAQVLEAQDSSKKEVLQEWEKCLQYSDPRYPEEDTWINIARQRVDP